MTDQRQQAVNQLIEKGIDLITIDSLERTRLIQREVDRMTEEKRLDLEAIIKGMTVAEYFDYRFPNHCGTVEFDCDCPLDSPVGRDCRDAIDNAAGFIDHIDKAVGFRNRQDVKAIIAETILICETYYHG